MKRNLKEVKGKNLNRRTEITYEVERMKNRVRQLLTKNNSTTMEDTFRYLTSYLRGWIGYCGLADINGFIRDMVKWSRRKIRAKYLKQWKRTYRKGMNIQKI